MPRHEGSPPTRQQGRGPSASRRGYVYSQHRAKCQHAGEYLPMQEPRAVVISDKANGDVVASVSNGDYVAADGVLVVVHRASGASNDREGMLETGQL